MSILQLMKVLGHLTSSIQAVLPATADSILERKEFFFFHEQYAYCNNNNV